MIKIDYEKVRQKQIESGAKNKKLLLHSCCAPCSSGVIDRLVNDFDITVYFYNPNMDSEEEFNRRASEQIRYVNEAYGDKVKVIIAKYDNEEYTNSVLGLENELEGGKRCEKCFYLRFNKCLEYAVANGYDYITTTLTVSPYKNANLINKIGEEICLNKPVKWLYCDFKKANGYLNSIQNSKKHGLYRQDYCGCIFSLKQAKERQKGSL